MTVYTNNLTRKTVVRFDNGTEVVERVIVGKYLTDCYGLTFRGNTRDFDAAIRELRSARRMGA